MATAAQITSLRRITDGASTYTDQEIGDMFDAGLTERQIAYRVWNEIAASAASLVDVSESGSSRQLSQAHRNALTMAAQYAPEADPDYVEPTVPKRTRRMVRG
ncbi:hypothetical protein SEA_WOLLYPOG_8 [Arthrobacter phage Wollypog]|uniref:Uncharacterized protein n=1 Tax=Arthrobacter phage Wollypog TaxID=2790985 RepID=A0A7T3KC61_9CAUD|nr:hypothetical protein PP291_gp08 [Arthrobacter phage Wollypog]QPX62561.1 hypothetical protein SEA_WOLLYPOG_8 [Arthrobacter phage Wollypog]